MTQTLDLHGVRHHDVERLVENLVLIHEDWKIICGNSDRMIQIVEEKLNWLYDNHKIKWHKNTHNTFRGV